MNRMRPVIIILALAFLLSFAACGRPSLGQAGIQGESSVATVRDLTSAYERRDIEAFMGKVSTAFPNRAALQQSIEKVFAEYQKIRFKALFSRSLITVPSKGGIKVTFTWEGDWQTGGGKVVKDGARVTLVLDAGTYKLIDIEGKNLFIPSEGPSPSRQ
jgi:hypothetical protein